MKKTDVDLGALVRKYRIEAGMTQLDLSTKLGYDSMQFVSLFERGLSKIPLKVIGKLVVLLGIPENKVSKALVDQFKSDLLADIIEGKLEVNKSVTLIKC